MLLWDNHAHVSLMQTVIVSLRAAQWGIDALSSMLCEVFVSFFPAALEVQGGNWFPPL